MTSVTLEFKQGCHQGQTGGGDLGHTTLSTQRAAATLQAPSPAWRYKVDQRQAPVPQGLWNPTEGQPAGRQTDCRCGKRHDRRTLGMLQKHREGTGILPEQPQRQSEEVLAELRRAQDQGQNRESGCEVTREQPKYRTSLAGSWM